MEKSKIIAAALERAKSAVEDNTHIIKSSSLARADREVLQRGRWLQDIMKGWYLLVRPDVAPGDSAAWYSNFWDFLNIYLADRFGNRYCLSAKASLELQIGTPLIPKQVIVIVEKGGSIQELPFNTSILTYADRNNIPADKEIIMGLQVMPLPIALSRVTPNYFKKNPENVEIALRSIRNPAELSKILLEHNHLAATQRIIGAYIALDLPKAAEQIKTDLERGGLLIKPENPFQKITPHSNPLQFRSPYAARITLMWKKYRAVILELFPNAPGLPPSPDAYLEKLNTLYEYDAYNSLSIEGYQVSAELINRVKENNWNPEVHDADAKALNALAARGYYEAFQAVNKSLEKIFANYPPGQCVEEDLSTWHYNLFAPATWAGIVSQADLIGYRNDRVFIRNSRHAPPPKEAVLDAMEAFFTCLKSESSAAVRAILGHYCFVYIHPYMDGNGRIARFILNTMLASGGYPWTIVQVAHRDAYIDALETTHTTGDIAQFTRFILNELKSSQNY